DYAMSTFVQMMLRRDVERAGVVAGGADLGRLSAVESPQTSVVALTVESASPAQSQAVANAWAAVLMRERGTLAALTKAPNATFVLDEFPKASGELAEASRQREQLLDRPARTLAAVESKANLPLKRSRLDSLGNQIIDAEREVSKRQTSLSEARNQVAAYGAELARTQQSVNLSRVNEQGVRLDTQEINPVYTKLAMELADARVRTATLEPSVDAAMRSMRELQDRATSLEREVAAARLEFDKLVREQKLELAPLDAAVQKA